MKTDKKRMKTHVVFAAFFILLIAIDRITKQLASTQLIKGDYVVWDGVLRLHYLENRGAAWGLLQDAFWLFYIVTVVVVVIMGFFYARIPFKSRYLYLRFILILLCAGAVGNFIDRALYKYVVDFIYFDIINFPVFNVADCYVTVSVPLLVHAFLMVYVGDDELWQRNLFAIKKTEDKSIESSESMHNEKIEENEGNTSVEVSLDEDSTASSDKETEDAYK